MVVKLNQDFPKFLKIATKLHVFGKLPSSALETDSNGTTVHVYDAKLISLLAEALGFKFEIVLPEDGQLGNALPDGNWTGIIGLVQHGQADIAIGRLAISEARAQVVDFSYPYDVDYFTFVTDKPEYLPSGYAIFYPFSLSVWTAIFASMIIVILLFYLIRSEKDFSRNALLMMYASLLLASVNFKTHSRPAKFLMFSWIVGAMFLVHCYNSVLLSFLTFPSITGIRDVSQLAKASQSSAFKCSAFPGSSVHQLLLNSNDDSFIKIGECLTRSMAFTNRLEDFLRPHTYKKAYLSYQSLLKVLSKIYFVSEDSLSYIMIAIVVRKSFCCKDMFDEVIHKVFEMGLIDKFNRDEEFFGTLSKSSMGTKESNPNRNLSLEDVSGAFILLLCGYIAAFAAFVIELLLASMHRVL